MSRAFLPAIILRLRLQLGLGKTSQALRRTFICKRKINDQNLNEGCSVTCVCVLGCSGGLWGVVGNLDLT